MSGFSGHPPSFSFYICREKAKVGLSGVNLIAVKNANNLFLNSLSSNGYVGIMPKYLLIRKSGTYTCQRTRGSVHSHLLPCAFASAPMCIRICPHVRLRLPPCSPNLLLLEAALLMAISLSTSSNCGVLRDGNDGMGHKNRGARLFIGEKNRIVEKY
nr:MAG TPA: hypothetical protein [Caudoviricetes sp.]